MPSLLTPWVRENRNQVAGQYVRGAVLDVGCGLGTIIPMLSADQPYVGVEVNVALVEHLRRQFPGRRFEVRDVDREPLALGDEHFDTVLMIAVIEHLHHPEWVLNQVRHYLRPEGRVVVTTPTPLGHQVHRWGTRLGLFVPEAAAEHKGQFDRPAMAQLLARVGMTIEHYQRFQWGLNQLFVCRVLTPLSLWERDRGLP
jgi:2-polyprenyl-3-methyl-5-hydroxy-6-metoxy-1,4-benzoquinol methylase